MKRTRTGIGRSRRRERGGKQGRYTRRIHRKEQSSKAWSCNSDSASLLPDRAASVSFPPCQIGVMMFTLTFLQSMSIPQTVACDLETQGLTSSH